MSNIIQLLCNGVHGIRPQMTSDLMSKLIFFFTFLRKHNIQTMIWMEKPAVYQRSPEAWFCFNCPFKNETKVYDFSQFITTHPQKSKWIDFQSNTLTKMTCDSKSQFRTNLVHIVYVHFTRFFSYSQAVSVQTQSTPEISTEGLIFYSS